MPALVMRPSETRARTTFGDGQSVDRNLADAYARERIEEVVRAVAEDAMNPCRIDVPPWHQTAFEADLALAVGEVADVAHALLAERLLRLLASAPPELAGRLATASRFSDHA